MIKPEFVHIPKTGGMAIRSIILQNYKDYFIIEPEEKAHFFNTSSYENPFVVVRDPIDRFFSLYSYWINGSEVFSDDIPKYSVDDFVYFLNSKNYALNTFHTWINFFDPQFNWIKPCDYHKTVVLVYKKELSESFNNLLCYFNIPVKSSKVPNFNVTKGKNMNLLKLSKELIKSIKSIVSLYKDDFELYNKVLDNPSLFKKVI